MSKFDISESLLKKFAKLIEEAGLTEVEFEEEGRRLRLTKQAPAPLVAPPAFAQDFSQMAPPVAAPASSPAGSAPTPAPAPVVDGVVVESQMVGTAYAAPEPGKPAFVAVGDQVHEGQTLLIIEAMKVLNQVQSPRAGVVKEIKFTDGEPVEYGQPLIVLGD